MKVNEQKILVQQIIHDKMLERGYSQISSKDQTYSQNKTDSIILGMHAECRKLQGRLRVDFRFCSKYKPLELHLDLLEGRILCRLGLTAEDWTTATPDLNFPQEYWSRKISDPIYGTRTELSNYQMFSELELDEDALKKRMAKIFEFIDDYGLKTIWQLNGLADIIPLITSQPRLAVAHFLMKDYEKVEEMIEMERLKMQSYDAPKYRKKFYNNLSAAVRSAIMAQRS